ncbi:GMC family oxidoreductase [Xylophilus sp. GOD-11R]|uniref:GMC family oxidoreductase n=1 Tax=Xylophilus sp. GOD-11R TaxID=3089814 RepID=UPI00298C46A9|nr:GMC family oxidoreductase N-terminal domain-containing protein [Xylophilus sp. GOD-11R]WPB57314.1 GMC family oxidoreductase N-terminal domain-containing protein [Xylophilus sp. GOD-11R]
MPSPSSASSATPTGTFDYVIVGAGAAGSVLANRLSAEPGVTVCLLEAGGDARAPWLRLPAGFIKAIFNPAWTWQYGSEPTANTLGRRVPIPQGRVLGGTSSINGLIYNRGQHGDFDGWAARGNPGWSYAEVLPYFMRSERHVGRGDPAYHGRDGELVTSSLDWRHPICDAFMDAAVGLGLPRNGDYNGATQAGVGYFQRTIDGRWRSGAASAFLDPVASRPNLEIRTRAQTVAIELEGKRATGVRYLQGEAGGPMKAVRARREVIVCAGAINTPKLLQLSGIGPAEHLRAHGITVAHALEGVGANLQDHYSVRVVARVRNSRTVNEMAQGTGLVGQVARWLAGRPNLLAVSPSLMHWFAKSRPDLAQPDLQGVFTPASYKEGYVGRLDNFPGMTAGVWGHQPWSVGSVRLRSSQALDEPLVQPNYLEDERDHPVLVSGIRQARALLASPALAHFFESETMPGAQAQSDDEVLDFARRYGVSACHLAGTARMGRADDPMAVVDATLKVHGLDGLRVVDASVMPSVPSANTCAGSMMVAEKAADMILGHAPLPAAGFVQP